MKTNKSKPSDKKRHLMSSDILTALRRKACPQELHHHQLPEAAFQPAAGDRYQVDSFCLDMSAVLPGAKRELGQAHLNILVDSATGQILDAIIKFGAGSAAPSVGTGSPYRQNFTGLVEQAFSRLLRNNPAN